ncbi:MAG: hypothetical protein ABIP12_07515, partial [Terriglobales bacterium]
SQPCHPERLGSGAKDLAFDSAVIQSAFSLARGIPAVFLAAAKADFKKDPFHWPEGQCSHRKG